MGLLGPTGALVIHTGETTQEKTFKYFYMAIDLNVKGKKCTNVFIIIACVGKYLFSQFNLCVRTALRL